MNGKERMICAFAHKEADMVPVGDPVIDSHVARVALGREAFVGQGGVIHRAHDFMVHEGRRDEYVEKFKTDTVDLFNKLDLDFIVTDFMPPREIATRLEKITENKWRLVDLKSGFWTEYVYEKTSDIVMEVNSNIKQRSEYDDVEVYLDNFEKSLSSQDPGIYDAIRHCKEKLGNEKLIAVKFPNLFPHGASWYTKFLLMFYEEIEMVDRMFELYTKRALMYIEELAKIGVDALYIIGDWCDNRGPMMSPDIIRKYLTPQIATLSAAAHGHGMYVIKHTDGNIMKIADDFFGMGIDAYHSIDPGANMDLKVMKKMFGDKYTLFGNVDCRHTLVHGSKDDIVSEVKQCIRDGAAGGGYVLSSSNTINAMIPAENFFTMVEAVRKYGRYPIAI